ncbi:MAG: hypothetical protein ACRENF_04705 [Thermodesulfobacteriota bacterium]
MHTEFSKNLRLNVKINDGIIESLTKDPLPRIKKGALATLVISSHYLENLQEVKEYISKTETKVLEKGARLKMRLSQGVAPHSRKDGNVECIEGHIYIPLLLLEDLVIESRGDDRLARCKPCKCVIDFGPETIEAKSINHAYTIATRIYEKKRLSRGGNIFRNVQFYDGKKWVALNHLRDHED